MTKGSKHGIKSIMLGIFMSMVMVAPALAGGGGPVVGGNVELSVGAGSEVIGVNNGGGIVGSLATTGALVSSSLYGKAPNIVAGTKSTTYGFTLASPGAGASYNGLGTITLNYKTGFGKN